MTCDPDSRDRYSTVRAISELVAQYSRERSARSVAPASSHSGAYDSYSWRAVSPRSGGGMQLQIGTRSFGCLHFRKNHVGCLNCGLPTAAAARFVTSAEIVAQVDAALRDSSGELDEVNGVCIQGDGSFLSPLEVPREAAYAVAERLTTLPQIGTVTMETRLDLVERDLAHILRVRSLLGPKKRLEVALGLESASDFVRNAVFRKGTGRACDIERVFALLADSDVDVLLYVFVKPAFLTEAEAVFDAVRTVFFVHSIAARTPHVCWTAALQPSFVQPDTFLAWLYGRGDFVPPSLWSVAEIMKRTAIGPALVHLGSPKDYPPPMAIAANLGTDGSVCGCSPAFYGALLDYNKHGSIEMLADALPRCRCCSVWTEAVQFAALAPALDRLTVSENHEQLTHGSRDGSSASFA